MKSLLRLLLVAVFSGASSLQAQTKIYIDPGHGGADLGAVNSAHGTHEADRVLLTGLELRRLLEKDTADANGGGSWSVRMSRSTDIFIPLGARSADANSWGADRFLSIHQNAYNETANGTETFSLSDSGTAADLRNLVQAEALKAWGRVNRGTKTAGYSVLRNSAMPAVLTEMGFIDSSLDYPYCASDEKCRDYAAHLLFALQKHYGLKEFLPAGAAPGTIVDNLSSTGYSETGDWETSPYKGFWDKDSRWAVVLNQTPPNTATFQPNLAEAGKYEVAAWWMAGSNRSPSAGFVIKHAAGSTVINAAAAASGMLWARLTSPPETAVASSSRLRNRIPVPPPQAPR
jgi:N-acetylmuramoyl-L-alanine amidase